MSALPFGPAFHFRRPSGLQLGSSRQLEVIKYGTRLRHAKASMQSLCCRFGNMAERSALMSETKQASRRKRRKELIPALGVVGVSLSLASGASAATDVADIPFKDRHQVLGSL
jgi:hypothetical protein